MSNDYLIYRLSAANIKDVGILYKFAYGRERPANWFLNKYDSAYTGAQYIGFIAYSNNIPIAYYGVIPTWLLCDSRKVLAAQSADTMTHPEYRNTGLFTRLANLTFTLCAVEGIKLVFGFPNQNSFPGFINKLQFQSPHSLHRFSIRVKSAVPLPKLVDKFPILKPGYNWYKRMVLSNYLTKRNGIENSVLIGNDGVLRDDSYLHYKSYSGTRVIQIGASTLWIKLSHDLFIGDMYCKPDDFDKTMKQLTSIAGKLGVQQIHFHVSPGTQLHALFARRYNIEPSFPVIFKEIAGDITTENIKFTFADIDIF